MSDFAAILAAINTLTIPLLIAGVKYIIGVERRVTRIEAKLDAYCNIKPEVKK